MSVESCECMWGGLSSVLIGLPLDGPQTSKLGQVAAEQHTAYFQLTLTHTRTPKLILHLSDTKQLWHVTSEGQTDCISLCGLISLSGVRYFYFQTVNINLFTVMLQIPLIHHSAQNPERAQLGNVLLERLLGLQKRFKAILAGTKKRTLEY